MAFVGKRKRWEGEERRKVATARERGGEKRMKTMGIRLFYVRIGRLNVGH